VLDAGSLTAIPSVVAESLNRADLKNKTARPPFESSKPLPAPANLATTSGTTLSLPNVAPYRLNPISGPLTLASSAMSQIPIWTLSLNSRISLFSSHRKLKLMPDLWYQLLSCLCAHFYFSRIDVLPARPNFTGPTLLVALHRNGAVDGWVYKSIFPSATFLIAAQLRKNLLARAFFTGITVVRDKDQADAGRSANTESMVRCQQLLASSGVLAIFPEGTSSLGPRHLPFKSGAARIAHEAVQRNLPLTILPLGITYDAPSTFRSNVQVIVGPAIAPSPAATLAELQHELSSRLESLGINAASEDHYRDIRALASFVAPEIPYHFTLKFLEPSIPRNLQTPWLALRDSLAASALLHPEQSPFSLASPLLTALAAVFLFPLVLAAALLNAPPLFAAYIAGRKFSDGPNVITLWRILVGAPLLLLWLLTVSMFALLLKCTLFFLVYVFLSLLGLFFYAPWKLHLRHSLNAFRSPSLRTAYLAFRCTLLQELRAHAC